MAYLELFFNTRLRERGQPRTKGLIRKRQVIEADAFIEALADTVRVAIAFGASNPAAAREVAMGDYDLDENSLGPWLDAKEERADLRVAGLADVRPMWRRFISIVGFDQGGAPEVFGWDESGQEIDAGSDEFWQMVAEAMSAYQCAFGWAIRNPQIAADWSAPDSEDSEILASAYESHVEIAETLLALYRSQG